MSESLTAVVSGSFRKPHELLMVADTVGWLRWAGVEVVAPEFGAAQNPGEEFVLLDTDEKGTSPRELEADYLDAIAAADLHVVANCNGRLGFSTTAEYAHAAVNGTARFVITTSVITSRDYPEVWFDGRLSTDEQSALERLSWRTFCPWRGVSRFSTPEKEYASLQRVVEETESMPESHPDYRTLSAIPKRLLADLPSTAALSA